MFPLNADFFNNNPDLYRFLLDDNPNSESAAKLAHGYLHHFDNNGSTGCETLTPLTIAIVTRKLSHFKAVLQVFTAHYQELLKKGTEFELELSFATQQAKLALATATEISKTHNEPIFLNELLTNNSFASIIHKNYKSIYSFFHQVNTFNYIEAHNLKFQHIHKNTCSD